MSAKTGQYIVCSSKAEADRVFKMAHKLGLSIPYPITYIEISKAYGPGVHQGNDIATVTDTDRNIKGTE